MSEDIYFGSDSCNPYLKLHFRLGILFLFFFGPLNTDQKITKKKKKVENIYKTNTSCSG